jgi:NitT/TauT family transport system permease protein
VSASDVMRAPAAGDAPTASVGVLRRTNSSWSPRRFARRTLPPLAALGIGIGLWQLAISVFSIPAYMLPSPATMWQTITNHFGEIWTPTLVTVEEAYLAFLLASVVGVLIALVMARWNIAEQGLYPYLIIIQTLPIVAIAPMFVVWLGAGLRTNMLVGAMIAVFPVAANTLQGLKSTDRNLVQLYTMAGTGTTGRLLRLRLPSALPAILTGLRVAAGASVIGAIVGEFVAGVGGGQGGLGYVITECAVQLRTPELFLAVFMASVVSLVLFCVVVLLERRLIGRWHESALPHDE